MSMYTGSPRSSFELLLGIHELPARSDARRVDPSGHQIDRPGEPHPRAGELLSLDARPLDGSRDEPRRQAHHVAGIVVAFEGPMVLGEHGVRGVGHQDGETFVIDVDADDGADRRVERKERPGASGLPGRSEP